MVESIDHDAVIVPASLSDYAPVEAKGKIPSGRKELEIKMKGLPKVLPALRKRTKVLVGFKAEVGADGGGAGPPGQGAAGRVPPGPDRGQRPEQRRPGGAPRPCSSPPRASRAGSRDPRGAGRPRTGRSAEGHWDEGDRVLPRPPHRVLLSLRERRPAAVRLPRRRAVRGPGGHQHRHRHGGEGRGRHPDQRPGGERPGHPDAADDGCWTGGRWIWSSTRRWTFRRARASA